mmetsp:Transcript_10347/g.18244  ORF Transcript_10347/g.18244 Transcript_10347/m.18244 type:complete len:95 (-) Transcript_10347:130-414(-)|eukprot:CAMPEP_0184523760 /NCGR_PEP_ID=MMETSP0198_2-20121128/9089_1 /TAXON_ID=1112570 /ORGANISM="Thraustochytrium sp., Strain LLF1b" /LENGTH=94 /DNA_ID=CAMNT_0026914879 /DNA_START=299 /DNA_END=583 /DNA_ORIENTATION=+
MSWRKALSSNAKELRFLVDSQNAVSSGLRDFIKGSYMPLKTANPTFPLIIRESEGAGATVLARFPFGKEARADVSGMDAKQVEAEIEKLLSSNK